MLIYNTISYQQEQNQNIVFSHLETIPQSALDFEYSFPLTFIVATSLKWPITGSTTLSPCQTALCP